MKRLISTVLCILVLSFIPFSAFATKPLSEDNAIPELLDCITLEVTSDGIASATNLAGENIARSSISRYGYGYLTSSSHGVTIYPEGSGIGGMGVTIRTSSSWNGYMACHMFDSEGNVQFEYQAISSNGERYFNDLLTVNPSFYCFNFLGIPDGVAVNVWIWIYG